MNISTLPGQESKPARLLSKQHLPVLDGVRAIAVVIVIIFHFWEAHGLGPSRIANRLGPWGQTGVDLFFVLSGFLITGILLDSRGGEKFLRNFYARRALRIFPLYYFVLVMFLLAAPALHWSHPVPAGQSWWFWVYLQNLPITFGLANPALLRHFWSLAVEEHYYFVWPLLVRLCDNRRLLRLTGWAVLLSLAVRVLFLKYTFFVFTPARLDGLGIGSAIAILRRSSPQGLKTVVPKAKALFFGLGAVLVVSQMLVSGRGLVAVQILKSTLIALVYGCGIVLAVEGALGTLVTRVLSSGMMRSIGKYSYAMYVFHPFVLEGLSPVGPRLGIAGGLAAGIVGSYLVARLSWVVLERPILDLKRYFEYSC